MIKKIDKFLNSQKMTQIIAQELVDYFVKHANKDNVEYDFELAKGTGRLKNNSPNTSFAYDPDPNSNIYEFKTALFDKDLEDISKDEELQLIKDVHAFLDKIKEIINTNNIKEIRDTIRKVVLPTSQQEDIPMNEIKIMTIEAIDYSSIPEPSKYLMRIGKAPDVQVNTEGIIQYINACQEKSGQSVETIFEEEKEANNPLFTDVTSVEAGKKYIFEVTMIFYVDYSLAKMPPRPPEIAPIGDN